MKYMELPRIAEYPVALEIVKYWLAKKPPPTGSDLAVFARQIKEKNMLTSDNDLLIELQFDLLIEDLKRVLNE